MIVMRVPVTLGSNGYADSIKFPFWNLEHVGYVADLTFAHV